MRRNPVVTFPQRVEAKLKRIMKEEGLEANEVDMELVQTAMDEVLEEMREKGADVGEAVAVASLWLDEKKINRAMGEAIVESDGAKVLEHVDTWELVSAFEQSGKPIREAASYAILENISEASDAKVKREVLQPLLRKYKGAR